MKLLFIGDFHETEKKPYARLDDWQETLDAKAEEILRIAKENNVKAILSTGDFLDVPKISEEYIQTILKRWGHQKTNEILLKESTLNGIPMVGVIGNHELFGNSMKNFNKTSLSVLEEIGFMRLVDRKPLVLKEGRKKIVITGTGYYPGIDQDVNGYLVKEKSGDVCIHIVHGYGTFKDLGPVIPHCNLTDYASQTKADITLIGHDHIGFGIQEVDDKTFVNLGSVTRLTAATEEIGRMPMIGLIDINSDYEKGYSIQAIPLSVAKKGDEVLSREHIVQREEKKRFEESVAEQVEQLQVKSHTTIKDIVDEITTNSNINSDVKNDILSRFNEKMKTAPSVATCDDYTVTSMHLLNFQSHKDTKLQFGNLNVFTGASGSGKTSIFRAFSWILENNVKNARRLIHKDEPFASATITLSNGLTITRKIERKKTGFNGYIVEYADGTTETLNTNGLPVIQSLLGFNYLTLSDNETSGINLNFLKQGDGWFFINSDIPGSERARMIGAIYKTHIADAIQKDLNLEAKQTQILLKEKEEEKAGLGLEIEAMGHVERMQKCIEEVQPAIERLEELQDKYTKLLSLEAKLKEVASQIERIDKTLNELKSVYEIKSMLSLQKMNLFTLEKLTQAHAYQSKCQIIHDNIDELKTFIDDEHIIHDLKSRIVTLKAVERHMIKRQALYKEMFATKAIIDELDLIKSNEQIVNRLKGKVLQFDVINNKVVQLKELKEQMFTTKGVIDNLNNHTVNTSPLINKLKEKIVLLQSVSDMNVKMDNFKAQIVETKGEIVEAKRKLKIVKQDYWDELLQMEVCPTCLQSVSDVARANMAKMRTKN